MATSPTLQEFLSSARANFAYLVEDYGFCEAPVTDRENSFLVKYERPPVRVSIEGINWGFGVQVMLTNMAAAEGEIQKIPLWAVEQLRNPLRNKPPSGQLRQLSALSESLRTYAKDILEGDFSSFSATDDLITKIANDVNDRKGRLP